MLYCFYNFGSGTELDIRQRVAALITCLIPNHYRNLTAIHISLHRLGGALTNRVYRVCICPSVLATAPSLEEQSNKTHPYHQLLLRVYGLGVDQLVDRAHEIKWLRRLTDIGIGPRLLAEFGNGRLEQFLVSRTLDHLDIRKPNISIRIAECVRQLHAVSAVYPPPTQARLGKGLQLWKNIDCWYEIAENSISSICERHPHISPQVIDDWRVGDIRDEINSYFKIISNNSYELAFCHNDLQCGNILEVINSDELTLVDLEYAGYNYAAFDFANHFCEWMSNYLDERAPHVMDVNAYPNEKQRHLFLRAYIEAEASSSDLKVTKSGNLMHAGLVSASLRAKDIHVLRPRPSTPLSSACVERRVLELDAQVQALVPASHLMWALWSIVQASISDISFDYIAYASQRLQLFREGLAKLSRV